MTRLTWCAAGLILTPFIARAQAFAIDSMRCTGASSAAARTTTPDTSGNRAPANSTPSRAAVMLFAAASAREVTFRAAPEIRVRLCGGLDSLHVVERRNLPNPVVVGRTYRDVYVAVEIFGRINADCIMAAINSAPRDSTGQRNACASLEISGARIRPPSQTPRETP